MNNNSIKIICDNGGGITLQVGSSYQHCYNDAAQAAEDIGVALSGGNPSGWEGNEAADGWLEPSSEQIRNGGYKVFSLESLRADTEPSWTNAYQLRSALIKTGNI